MQVSVRTADSSANNWNPICCSSDNTNTLRAILSFRFKTVITVILTNRWRIQFITEPIYHALDLNPMCVITSVNQNCLRHSSGLWQ